MNVLHAIHLALEPCKIVAALGFAPDRWQNDVLVGKENLLLNCHRQAGKSTIVGVKACAQALSKSKSVIVILSRTQRQAVECFRKFLDAYYASKPNVPLVQVASQHARLDNGSRVLALPGREDTIRGYSGVNLLILDEAARIPDALYAAVRPMVAVSQGQIICLSTPFGQRGFFHREWIGDGPWRRIAVPVTDCPRITARFLDDERRALGDTLFAQEYLNSFVAVEGLVYPHFGECRMSYLPRIAGRKVGGIDWGWRNPFAAVWGTYDPASDVLWIEGERYARGEPLHKHRDVLKPLGCFWFADPAGATEIAEFRAADVPVRKGNNDVMAGIAAITARIDTGRLKVYAPACPNLLREAQLYRYPDKRDFHPEPEKPLDEHNHALAALRYLVSKLDNRFMARFRDRVNDGPAPARHAHVAGEAVAGALDPTGKSPSSCVDVNDPQLWTVVN